MTHSSPLARVLFIPYEKPPNTETASRRTLLQLREAGLIDDLYIYSIQRKILEYGHKKAIIKLREVVAEFQPNLVLLYHPVGTGLDDAEYRVLRSLARFRLVYHEVDPFHWLRNPFPKEARAAARASDVVYTSGAGAIAEAFRRFGAPDVRWMPQSFDPHAINIETSNTSPKIDIVMIANNGISRNPFRGHPGARSRRHLVNILTKRFGERFRVYGRGWDGPSAGGVLPFAAVREALAGATLSVNWDHYPTEAKYFSNRLPISLASGSVHFTTWHPGYDEIFPPNLDFLHFGRTPEELADRVEGFLRDHRLEERNSLADQARSFAHERFRRDEAIGRIIRGSGFTLDVEHRIRPWAIEVDPFPDLVLPSDDDRS